MTWKGLITVVISAVTTSAALIIGLISWSWSIHSSQPHVGAVEQQEYARDHAQLETRLERMERKIDAIYRDHQ